MNISVLSLISTIFFCLPLFASSQISLISNSDESRNSHSAQTTPDGRYIVFVSAMNSLTNNDQNDRDDIFLYDNQTKTTTRISHELEISPYGRTVSHPSISNDGRFIVYQSTDRNLTPDNFSYNLDDNNNYWDNVYLESNYYHIYLYDRLLDSNQLISDSNHNNISRYGNIFPKISGNGQYIVYLHQKEQITDNNNFLETSTDELYFYGIEEATRTIINTHGCHPHSGTMGIPDINDSGEYIVFAMGSPHPTLEKASTTNTADICLAKSQQNTSTSIVSQSDIENQAWGSIYDSYFHSHPQISADGRFITYETYSNIESINNKYGNERITTIANLANVFLYDKQDQSQRLIYQESNNVNWIDFTTYRLTPYNKSNELSSPYKGYTASISGNNQYVLMTGSNFQGEISGVLYHIDDKTIQALNLDNQDGPLKRKNIATDIGYDNSVIVGIIEHTEQANQYEVFSTNQQIQNYYPRVSSPYFQMDDILEIDFEITAKGDQQIIGLQMPNQDIFLFDKEHQLVPYSEENLPTNVNEINKNIRLPIDESFPAGIYHAISYADTWLPNGLQKVEKELKTQFSINELFRFPSETNIYNDNKCLDIIHQTPGFEIFGYSEAHTKILFSTYIGTHKRAMINYALNDIFICTTSSGEIKSVMVNEEGLPFAASNSIEYPILSKDGSSVVFQRDNEIYLYQEKQHKSLILTFPDEAGCSIYRNQLIISDNGSQILFPCLYESEQLNKVYLWEAASNQITDISHPSSQQADYTYFKDFLIAKTENLIAFSSTEVTQTSEKLYYYDKSLQTTEIIPINFQNVSHNHSLIQSAENSHSHILDITPDGETFLFSYFPNNSLSVDNKSHFYAIFERKKNQSQLLKLAGTDSYLKLNNSDTKISPDGRLLLLLSSSEQTRSDQKPLFGQAPYIYLYDRETEKLQQIEIQAERYQEIDFTADGKSFRLEDSIYLLTRYATLSSSQLSNGDILNIDMSDLPPGYQQFIAIQNPQGEVLLYTSPSNSVVFNGQNFVAWQEDSPNLKIEINDKMLRGKYHVYLLTLPASIEPIGNNEQWQLGLSVFNIE